MFAQTLVMTLVSGAKSAGQSERCGQMNCETPALSVVVHMCRYVECSFVCTFGSSYRVPETNCVHPFTSSLFSQHFLAGSQMASVVFFIQHILVAVERFLVELIKFIKGQAPLSS